MKEKNLQDLFLTQAKKLSIPVTINLINSSQIKGHVSGFDNFTVIVDYDNRQNLVYKHAIISIIPAKPIELHQDTASESQE